MKKQYIILNKPYGYLSQFTPEVKGQKTLEAFNLPKGVYAAGRLDKNSEGLLLLSDDGPFIKEFLDSHPRTYWAQVENIPSEYDLDKLRQGITLKDGLTKPCKVKILSGINLEPRDPPIRERVNIPTCWIELILAEGKNRQVRRMTAAIGFPTLRLIRVGLGKLKNLDIKSGSWMYVKKSELI